MKHDGHFQPYAYGITAVKQKSNKSRSGERERERQRERVGEEEGFRSLLRKRAKQRSMDESLMHAAAAIFTVEYLILHLVQKANSVALE